MTLRMTERTMISEKTGTIVILNGTSSSGKSSIVRALQGILEEPYLEAGLDKFLWMLPKQYLNHPLWDEVLGLADKAGPVGHRLVSGMHQAIAALSRAGNHVVAEHVLVDRSWLAECANLFSQFPALFVGVYCPLEVLEQRERSRKDRTLGQARRQFDIIHAHGVYDVQVDTSIKSVEECALVIRGRIQDGPPFDAFARLKKKLSADRRSQKGHDGQ